jgi:hypothetical protein
MQLNEKVKAWFGISVAGLFVLLAGNGKEFLEAATAFPALANAWASGLPLGLWSIIVAWLVGMVIYLLAEHALETSRMGRRASETIAILVVIGVAQAQVWVGGGDAEQRLNALWLGIVFGYFAPYVARRLHAVYTTATHAKVPAPKDDVP